MRLRVATLLGLLATDVAAQAPLPKWNPKAPENNQLLPAFTYANVTNILTAVGARFQRSGTDPAKPAAIAIFTNGRRALISFNNCDKAGSSCKALSIQSFWAKSATVSPERTARAIESFNQRYAFSKAFVTSDGRPALQRYLTADYGFIRGDLAVNLLVFADQAESLSTDFLQPLERSKKP